MFTSIGRKLLIPTQQSLLKVKKKSIFSYGTSKLKILHKKRTQGIQKIVPLTHIHNLVVKFHLLGPLAEHKKLTGSCPRNCRLVLTATMLDPLAVCGGK